MTEDRFMWGLASLFPASLFNSALGGPLQQLQGASQFFFGSDDEKEKFFMGSPLPYPINALQVVSPPLMRVPYSVFGAMLSCNWDRFAEYHVWTWFPFGRVAHDVAFTLDNPVTLTEKAIGLPIHQFEQKVVEARMKEKRRRVSVTGIM